MLCYKIIRRDAHENVTLLLYRCCVVITYTSSRRPPAQNSATELAPPTEAGTRAPSGPTNHVPSVRDWGYTSIRARGA